MCPDIVVDGDDPVDHDPQIGTIPIQPDPPPLDLVAARPDGEPPPAVAAFLEIPRAVGFRPTIATK